MFIVLNGEAQRLVNILQINTIALAKTPRDTFCVNFLMINELEISSEEFDTLEKAKHEYDDIHQKIVNVLNSSRRR